MLSDSFTTDFDYAFAALAHLDSLHLFLKFVKNENLRQESTALLESSKLTIPLF